MVHKFNDPTDPCHIISLVNLKGNANQFDTAASYSHFMVLERERSCNCESDGQTESMVVMMSSSSGSTLSEPFYVTVLIMQRLFITCHHSWSCGGKYWMVRLQGNRMLGYITCS